mmetsp:Transcript_66236/g.130340  ORF Transcript_66236/g.130340 Transcript_66236/m.130340 type:complete len:87 (+) Transcript_66236:110-370(+)
MVVCGAFCVMIPLFYALQFVFDKLKELCGKRAGPAADAAAPQAVKACGKQGCNNSDCSTAPSTPREDNVPTDDGGFGIATAKDKAA